MEELKNLKVGDEVYVEYHSCLYKRDIVKSIDDKIIILEKSDYPFSLEDGQTISDYIRKDDPWFSYEKIYIINKDNERLLEKNRLYNSFFVWLSIPSNKEKATLEELKIIDYIITDIEQRTI